jgi:hypothetical protein
MTTLPANSLKYIAEALGQMADMLRDFELPDAARHLQQAKTDIEHRLNHTSDEAKTQ